MYKRTTKQAKFG